MDLQHASQERVQVAFRMEKEAYREIKRMALDADITINELMLLAINELRERKGLKKLPQPGPPGVARKRVERLGERTHASGEEIRLDEPMGQAGAAGPAASCGVAGLLKPR
jgi:hypothetical protein